MPITKVATGEAEFLGLGSDFFHGGKMLVIVVVNLFHEP